MKTLLKFLNLLLFSFVSGCVLSTAPKNQADFAKVESIRAFEGCYQNLGEGGESTYKTYLTAVIWPELKLDHTSIKVVRVVVLGEKTLRVTAETDGKILHKGLFV